MSHEKKVLKTSTLNVLVRVKNDLSMPRGRTLVGSVFKSYFYCNQCHLFQFSSSSSGLKIKKEVCKKVKVHSYFLSHMYTPPALLTNYSHAVKISSIQSPKSIQKWKHWPHVTSVIILNKSITSPYCMCMTF